MGALEKITKQMDERLATIMAGFDKELADLKDMGVDFPSFEEWEKDFDEEKWRAEDPELAATIDDMFKAPEDGWMGGIMDKEAKKEGDKVKEGDDDKKQEL